jgi:hypothetical protein
MNHFKNKFIFAAPLIACAISIGAQAEEEWSEDWDDQWEDSASTPALPLSGYIETTFAYRTKESGVIAEEWVAQDLRGRIQTYYQGDAFSASYKGELYFDGIDNEWHAENREAFIGLSPTTSTDLRLGRQILTWGTGDLLFLNDFFPKNWVAFFSGYDQQYLKASSDAIKLSGYTAALNVDITWSPKFDPDNYINGEKLVYYSPVTGELTTAPPTLTGSTPESKFSNGELSLRLYRTIDGVEYAGYFYRGFFKTPVGFDSTANAPYFPKLSSLGASVRASIFSGIGNIEYAHWDSREDSNGDNPLISNSQSRLLLGYETEIIRNLTASFQYYNEYTHDYSNLKATSPYQARYPRKLRQVLTTRWTLSTQQTNVMYSFFAFYSPSNDDYYLIPNVLYRMGDNWQFNAGGNLLGGKHNHTLFGQMEDNSNIYLRSKYIF